MSVLVLKRLQVRRLLVVHRPAMVPLPAMRLPLPVCCPVKPATALPLPGPLPPPPIYRMVAKPIESGGGNPRVAQPVGADGGADGRFDGGWYEYLKKQYKKREFEVALTGVIYTALMAWKSYESSKQLDENITELLIISQMALQTCEKALEISQKSDARSIKILEVCERLDSKSSTKHSSFFGRFASAFWWDKTEEGKAGGGESGKGEDDRM